MVPTVASPPAMAFTLHVTPVFDVPPTAAVNCRVAPTTTDAVVGLSATVTGSGAVTARLTDELVVPPMPEFTTVIFTFVPASAAAATPVAFRLVGETYVVASGVPPNWTTEVA